MKLCRFGSIGRERPGIFDEAGVLRDASSLVADWSGETIADLSAIRAADLSQLPPVEGTPRMGVPVAGIGKFVAIGLNYADHAREAGLEPPPEPIFFTKAISCLNGPDDPVMLPRDATKMDWEVELGVIIGKTCRYVEEADALDHVAGFVLANDISERAFQKERGSQWDKGKGCDTFGPVGPWLVTPDEVGDCQTLELTLDLNGERMQTGTTATMIFPVAECIAYLSRFLTLHPGDLVITGTPPGVGEGQTPQRFLRAGDRMRLSIAGLGEQNQQVLPFSLEGPST